MAKVIKAAIVSDETVMSKIYMIRGQKVMIDKDLAELYGVETRVLKQAVRRNIERFPQDFMFEMTTKELENWRSQFVISNLEKMGLRHPPFCFTEQGVAMLSSVLNSEMAIRMHIQIIRAFTRMRELMSTNKDILLKLQEIEKRLTGHDSDIALIFEYLKQLLNPSQPPRPRIGFKPNDNH
jgi:hypothetical protein